MTDHFCKKCSQPIPYIDKNGNRLRPSKRKARRYCDEPECQRHARTHKFRGKARAKPFPDIDKTDLTNRFIYGY